MQLKLVVSWKWVVLWSLWASRLVRQPTPALRTRSGWLRGSVAHHGLYNHYLGIPFATVLPEHRFKTADPAPTWNGVFEAINENIRCLQKSSETSIMGQEDCLTLNVYTPFHAHKSSKLSVMVFIHGGGFAEGSGSRMIYDPSFLVPKDVVLVTYNYRLNIQGFLCLRTKDAPGNAAMKDQVAALRWVQSNIAAFGGNPDDVTLFGESAGAASVSYHLLSPMSKGLFHKAILQSGSSLAPWAYQLRPIYMASLLTKTMGYKTGDPKELFDILISKSDEELILTKVPRKEGNTFISEVIYTPCTEAVLDGEEAFLTSAPHELLKTGKYNKVPIIIGINSEEGYFFAAFENDTTIPQISFEKSLPKDITITSEEEKNTIADNLKQLYMDDEEISKETLLEFSRFIGDMYFNLPAFMETEFILKTTERPVFNYVFDYNGWRSLGRIMSSMPSTVSGATHVDELFYLFRTFHLSFTYFDREIIDIMTSLWTNFAKFGDPTPADVSPTFHWPPTTAHDPRALILGSSSAYTKSLWSSDSLLYWREIYKKYRRKYY